NTGTGGCHVVGGEVRVTNAAGRSSGPVLVWTGTNYLLVWSDERSGAGDIYRVTMSADGVKQGDEMAIVSTPSVSQKAALTQTARGYMVAWQDQTTGGFAVMSQALDASGQPSGTAQTLGETTGKEARPVLAQALGGVAAAFMDVPAAGPGALVLLLNDAG